MNQAQSTYQSLKLWMTGIIPISRDAFHVYIGCVVFLLTLLITKRKTYSWSLLLPVVAVAVGMETLDLTDDIRSLGYPRWNASFHDIVNTTLIPILLFLALKIKELKKF